MPKACLGNCPYNSSEGIGEAEAEAEAEEDISRKLESLESNSESIIEERS
jgi:hypothetical protein